MTDEAAGVREPMESPDSPRRPLAATGIAFGLLAVLLAGEPVPSEDAAFSTGAVLRSVVLALVTAIALFTAWTGPGVWSRPRRAHLVLLCLPLAVPLLALLHARGLPETLARHGVVWLALVLLPLALLGIWNRRADVERAWHILVVGGVIAAVFVLMSALAGRPAVGPFGRIGIAGPVLGALAVPAWLLSPWRHRALRWIGFGVIVIACVLTRSRTGILALVAGLAFAAAITPPLPDVRKRVRMIAVGGGALVVIVLGLMVQGSLPFPGDRSTVDVRLGLHRTSLQLVSAQPLDGHGLGSYATSALAERDLAEARLEPRRRARHAHLDYLHVSVEGGLLAGLALLLYMGGLLVTGVRTANRAPGPAGRRHAGASLGVVATLAVAALGDGVLLDPASALLLAVAATALVLPAASATRTGLAVQGVFVLGAVAALGCAYVLAKDALADHALMRYRRAIRPGVTPREASDAAQRYLAGGALRWRPDAPEALYRLGVQEASAGNYTKARETFRSAIQADPGATEARLDLAQVYALEGRLKDARSVLEEARRRDPTRYAVRRRLMELALGEEPVPGDPPTPFDEIQVLRLMNEARAVAPERFENRIDEARVERRRATDTHGLRQAGALLRAALAGAPGPANDPPAEILIESFRLAEAENVGRALINSSILKRAFEKNPRPARRFHAEAMRFLDAGQERVAAARERAGGDPTSLDMKAADRAFSAATTRLVALLFVGLLEPESVLQGALADQDAKRFRRALAQYRSLLAWTKGPGERWRPPQRAFRDRVRQSDLYLDAASVAQRIDKALALFYRTQGQLRMGVELLQEDRARDAIRKFRSVIDTEPDTADAHYGLARALARTQQGEAAARMLLRALSLRPELRGRAIAEPDLASLRQREDVKQVLKLP